jgi:hypothetical protein
MGPNDASVLQRLLDDELAAEPTTIRGLTNHLPMALVAKANLGADEAELQRFAAKYATRIAPLGDVSTRLERSTWVSAIGESAAAADLRDYFVRCVNDDGVDATLRSHLRVLLPGIGGAGFHGAIRLAYAIQVASPSRIAAGLAYLAEVARPLKPLSPGNAVTHDPVEILAALSRSGEWSTPFETATIDEEMRYVVRREGFDTAVAALHVGADTQELLASAALQVFASTGNFTALHGVTGLSAIRALRPWTEDVEELDRFAFQALSAAYLSFGAPPLWTRDQLEEFSGANGRDPAEVKASAAQSDDEHVAKLVYTAHGCWEHTRDDLYLAVAAREAFPSGPSPS